MRLRTATTTIFALCSQAALACITVDVPPRDRFHGATMIVRGTAEDLFGFRVVKSWRGDARPGTWIIAEYSLTACGSVIADNKVDYIVYTDESPTLDNSSWVLHHARLIPVVRAQRAIAFLDAQPDATILDSRELVRVLSDWHRNSLSTEHFRDWLAAAETREVDDWRASPDRTWSLMNEVLRELGNWTRSSPDDVDDESRPRQCRRLDIVRSHAVNIMRLIYRPPGDEDECRIAFEAIFDMMGQYFEQLGC